MRQRIRSHLTYANVMATLAVFLVIGGGTALASYVVSSNSQVGPGTISGHQPPSGDHANIIGGSINGKDVAANSLGGAAINEANLTGDAKKLDYNTSPTGTRTTIARVGPYAIKGECSVPRFDAVQVRLLVNGPAGTADAMWSVTGNDTQDGGDHSDGKLIPANTDTTILALTQDFGDYTRAGGRAILRSGSTLVQIDFEATADSSGNGSCFIYGTATNAT
jgi:hypothetical protein